MTMGEAVTMGEAGTEDGSERLWAPLRRLRENGCETLASCISERCSTVRKLRLAGGHERCGHWASERSFREANEGLSTAIWSTPRSAASDVRR